MKKIHVSAGGGYEICIGRGLLAGAGEAIREVKAPCGVMLLCDSTVAPLYGETVERSLTAAGYSVSRFVFPAGERSKNLETLGQLLEAMGAAGLTRSDLLVALGGGVTGDMGGFAAAVYQRGIDYVQIPTTLLAAVDSSVGGKTAVDLRCGKNMAGCFWQPRLVLCDCDTFRSLPDAVFADGMAEVIKYGLAFDENYLTLLESAEAREIAPEIVARCCDWKRRVVEADEREAGERKLLNLGHTIGHAVELSSDFTVSHGHAVAIGMCAICRAAEHFGVCRPGTEGRICALCRRMNLPTDTDIPVPQLCRAARADKKRGAGHITVAVPVEPGRAVLQELSMEELDRWIETGVGR